MFVCLKRRWYGRLTPSLLIVPCRSWCRNLQDAGGRQQVAADTSSSLEWGRLPSCLALDETLSRFTEVINTSYLHKQPYDRV